MTASPDVPLTPCPCGGQYQRHAIEVPLTIEGEPVRLADVIEGVCNSCGARVYDAQTLERVEAAMKGRSPDPALNRR